MKHILQHITEHKSTLLNLMDKILKNSGDVLLVASHNEDFAGRHIDIAEEYHIGELIITWSNMAKKNLGTKLNVLDLTELNIQKPHRHKGYARKVLGEICQWCDDHNFVLTGDPDDIFGADLKGLYKLYAKFQMLPNPKYDAKKHPYSKIVRWPNRMTPDNALK